MTNMALEAITSASLVDQVVNRLVAHIGAMPASGAASLGSEPALARQLGVSRPVLREALSRLKLVGVLRSRQRVGLEIGQPDPFAALVLYLGLDPDGDALAELRSCRLVLERAVADQIFERCGLEDLVQLEAIVQDEASDPFAGERRWSCDRAFHACLYRLVGNSLLQRQLSLLAGHLDGRRWQGELLPEEPLVSHADLLDILRSGSPKAWRQAIGEHLDEPG